MTRRFKVLIEWADGRVQRWYYPHKSGTDWLQRSLTADEFLASMEDSISQKTTECPDSLRDFLLGYFFDEDEETESGGYGIILSVEELDAHD